MNQKLQLPSLRKVDPDAKKKIKILLLSDDLRLNSGIATMSREFVLGTAHVFDWVQLGAAINSPDQGKILDISDEVNKQLGIDNANIKIYPNNGYGNPDLVNYLIKVEKPDAILHFTDPRYWEWLYLMERTIRQQIPIMYYTIWDDLPYPHWNEKYYESCDLLMCISKQTENIIRNVLVNQPKPDWAITYVPHGINENVFYPITEADPEYMKYQMFVDDFKKQHNVEFLVFWNNRNVHRKHPADVMLSFKLFVDSLPEEKRDKVGLLMHTQIIDGDGTDLFAVRDMLCFDYEYKFIFSNQLVTPTQMNYFYNLAAVTLNIASNEGFGLSGAESLMAGTVIVNNVTGGLQDQLRFEDVDGNWIEFNTDFPSNHNKTYTRCGVWGRPVYPSNRSIQGSPVTPYIFDDRVDCAEVATEIKYWYDTPQADRVAAGAEGRRWMLSTESGMSAPNMCNRMIESINTCIEKWTPRRRFDFYKAENKLPKRKAGLLHNAIQTSK